jgi:galactonate dehydratase
MIIWMRITHVRSLVIKIAAEDSFGGTGRPATSGWGSYFRQPGWRGVYSDQTETTLVKIETDEGICGFGEGQSPIGPETTATIIDRVLQPILIGRDPTDVGVLRHEMYDAMNIRGHYGGYMAHAISGVDTALWDVRGKQLGQSVASLLGGAFRDQIPCYVSGVRGKTLADKAATVREFAAKGFSAVKTFLGFGLEKDLEHVQAFIEALGANGRLMVDVLWNYDVPSAIRLGRSLERLGVEWLEAPTAPEDIAGHAEIARSLDMAVATGETETTRFQFIRWFEQRALDIAQPDVARCGITEARKIADLAETFNIPVAPHCGILFGPGIAASLQVAAAIPNLSIQEYQPVMLSLANKFLKEPLVCEQGFFRLPKGPGLGIELDEEALAPYIVNSELGSSNK